MNYRKIYKKVEDVKRDVQQEKKRKLEEKEDKSEYLYLYFWKN